MHQFDVIVEKDSEGYYVVSVPALTGCHTQAKSLDELMENASVRLLSFVLKFKVKYQNSLTSWVFNESQLQHDICSEFDRQRNSGGFKESRF